MKVTKIDNNDRKLNNTGCLQKVSSEKKEYAEVSSQMRITENNNIITDLQTDKLLEKILHRDNMNEAFKKVKKNKGSGGVDKMEVDELLSYLRENKTELLEQLKNGRYKPKCCPAN